MGAGASTLPPEVVSQVQQQYAEAKAQGEEKRKKGTGPCCTYSSSRSNYLPTATSHPIPSPTHPCCPHCCNCSPSSIPSTGIEDEAIFEGFKQIIIGAAHAGAPPADAPPAEEGAPADPPADAPADPPADPPAE